VLIYRGNVLFLSEQKKQFNPGQVEKRESKYVQSQKKTTPAECRHQTPIG